MPTAELLGHIQAISGSQATVALLRSALSGRYHEALTVGKFLKIRTSTAILIGVITDVSMQGLLEGTEAGDPRATAHVYLMGEISRAVPDRPSFRRGVSDYPTIGDVVEPLTNAELRLIFEGTAASRISAGTLQQDSAVTVCIDADEMLSKHFAILGSTGVGKSSAVAHILRQVIRVRPDLRIFLLDAHNEYDRCFGEQAYVVNPGNLKLPFWLFSFDEIVDVIFGGRPGLQDEIDLLAEVVPIAKANYNQYRPQSDRLGIKRFDTKSVGYTLDTPVPYRMSDLISLLDERMGKLENRSTRLLYGKLISRIETVSNDPRYMFMFENANVGGDTMAEAISQLFRLPTDGRPITVMQLAGFPAEVVDAVVSVLTRMAFDFGLWSDGSDPLVFVCEEAHKYASADRSSGFAPTRRAISRIAKEGRKYGIYLGVVTQRPAEIDPTIISQCGTIFAMRMSNERDQALLRSAVADTAANLIAFVPTLGTREAVAFGAGVPLPTRVTFAELPAQLIPRSDALSAKSGQHAAERDLNYIGTIIDRWRTASMSRNPTKADPPRESAGGMAMAAAVRDPAPPALDPNRYSLLKKPVLDQPIPPIGARQIGKS